MDLQLLRALQRVNWDFPSKMPGTTIPLHWYPGTFTPSLPATLIEALSKPGSVVFDPFGGIGTTAAEAIRLGRRTWLAESNPVGLLTAYTTTGLLVTAGSDQNLLRRAISELGELTCSSWPILDGMLFSSSIVDDLDELVHPLVKATPEANLQSLVPGSANLNPALEEWIHSETLVELQNLVERVILPNRHNFFGVLTLTMVSAVLKSLSSQTRSWGHLADNVKPKTMVYKSVSKACRRWLNLLRRFVDQLALEPQPRSTPEEPICRLFEVDWSQSNGVIVGDSNRPDLLLMSPPYPGAIDYILAQRLSLYLFAFTEEEIMKMSAGEIGARRKRFSKAHASVWKEEVIEAIEMQLALIAPNAMVALVLPQRGRDGEETVEAIRSLLGDAGRPLVLDRERSIDSRRTRQSWTAIKKETILVYGGSE